MKMDMMEDDANDEGEPVLVHCEEGDLIASMGIG